LKEAIDMSDWKTVDTQEDIEELMATYGDFHDACIVSVSYHSGAFVDDEGAMHFGDAADYEARVVFHCQWEPKVIELCFTGLRQFHLVGQQEHYICVILEAYLAFHEGILPGTPERVIVWSDYSWFDVEKIDNSIHEPADTYIVANALKWRIIEE
jgi:hypothetical protein